MYYIYSLLKTLIIVNDNINILILVKLLYNYYIFFFKNLTSILILVIKYLFE